MTSCRRGFTAPNHEAGSGRSGSAVVSGSSQASNLPSLTAQMPPSIEGMRAATERAVAPMVEAARPATRDQQIDRSPSGPCGAEHTRYRAAALASARGQRQHYAQIEWLARHRDVFREPIGHENLIHEFAQNGQIAQQ